MPRLGKRFVDSFLQGALEGGKHQDSWVSVLAEETEPGRPSPARMETRPLV